MRIRILSALVLLPLATACTEVLEAPPEEAAEVAQEAAAAPVVVAAATPAPRAPRAAPAAASPAPTPARAVPTPPPAVAASTAPPAAPPAAEEEEEVAEAPAVEPVPAGQLGTTVASLGPPTDAGLWLETALVEAPTQGRIEYNGQSVSVELRPSGGEPGSGSQISVDAMRALGAPLTGLPEVAVFAG